MRCRKYRYRPISQRVWSELWAPGAVRPTSASEIDCATIQLLAGTKSGEVSCLPFFMETRSISPSRQLVRDGGRLLRALRDVMIHMNLA